MRDWFNNLESKYKTVIHVVLILAFFIIPCCSGENVNSFVYLIWLSLMVLEIIFIVWHVKFAKQNNSEDKNNITYTNDNKNKNSFNYKINETKYEETKPIIKQNQPSLNTNKKSFVCDLELKADNKALSSFIKTFIDTGWYSKEDLYEGMSNKEIEEAGYEVYQLEISTYDAEIRFFEGSNSIGIYSNDGYEHSKYLAVVPTDKRDEIRKIMFFDKNQQCSITLEGGKYKEYDYEEEKVVIKENDYTAKLTISYIENNDSEEKINNIIEIEKNNKRKMKVFNTYIAGVTFNNDDGSNRKQILSTLKQNEEVTLEKYLYEGSKAVRILTKQGQMIGNIPKDFSEMVYNALEEGAVYIAMYNPEFYNGKISKHCVRLLLK